MRLKSTTKNPPIVLGASKYTMASSTAADVMLLSPTSAKATESVSDVSPRTRKPDETNSFAGDRLASRKRDPIVAIADILFAWNGATTGARPMTESTTITLQPISAQSESRGAARNAVAAAATAAAWGDNEVRSTVGPMRQDAVSSKEAARSRSARRSRVAKAAIRHSLERLFAVRVLAVAFDDPTQMSSLVPRNSANPAPPRLAV